MQLEAPILCGPFGCRMCIASVVLGDSHHHCTLGSCRRAKIENSKGSLIVVVV